MLYTAYFCFKGRIIRPSNSAKFGLVKLVPPSVLEWSPNEQASILLSQALQMYCLTKQVVGCSQHFYSIFCPM